MLTVLIGPPGAGKSTVGALLAHATGRPFVDADEHAHTSYARTGWSVTRLRQRADEVGFEAAHAEWEPALVAAVVDLVAAHPSAVLALGAGHSHLSDPQHLAQVAAALSAADQVVALRPSPVMEESLAVLRERCQRDKGHDWRVDGVDWLQRWLADGCDERLAHHVLFTGEDPPPAVADQIVDLPAADRTARVQP